jgi:dipeptidyl aminopeptidase/acylaminoacyl peptidase
MRFLRYCAVLLAIPCAVVAAPPAFSPADVFALEWAERPQLSPDGRRIVYQRSFFDAMKDVRRSNLWLVDVGSGAQRPLTTGATNDRGAVWSPDGKRLAWVASDGTSVQIFVRWLDGGETARITRVQQGPGSLAWSPDGKRIAFTARVPAEPKPLAIDLPKPPKGAEWAAPMKVIEEFTWRFDGAGEIEPGYSHVFVVSADGGAPRQVTQGEHDFDGPLAWTRDGKALILAANPVADADHDPLESDLYRVAVDDGALTRLTTRDGPDNSPSISADGRHVAYVGFEDRRLGYQNAVLSVLDLQTGETRALTGGLDRTIDNPQWDGDRGIWFHFDDRGVTRIGWIAARGGEVQVVASDLGGTAMGRPYDGGSLHAVGSRVAYTHNSNERPADVAVVERGGTPRVLSAVSEDLLAARTLGKVEEITWKSSFDQREVQGWLVYPPGFNAQQKYPLLLEIHGGPFANYGPRFAPEIQLYAARGYLVLFANPRGSTSYGEEFANLIHHNYPGQDYDDLISGVDAVIARGNVDEKNLFVTGGSGGGVLTAWIVGHTDRFRAAVVAKPVINWYSFALTADAYGFFSQYWFPGKPWDHVEHYMKRSPISYVKNVRTPTMLITGEADLRTPMPESEQYYQALQLLGVPTALVRIPGASHAINQRPSQMVGQVLHTAAWFERHRHRDRAAAK